MTITHVTAIVSPRPGKEARFQELLEAVVRGTTNEEEGARTYVLTKAVDSSDFVIVESYASMEAFKFHQSQQYFKTLAQVVADEDLLSKPPIVVISEKFCGFEGRSNTGEVLA